MSSFGMGGDPPLCLMVKTPRGFRCAAFVGSHHPVFIIESPAQILALFVRVAGQHFALALLTRGHR